MKKYFEAKALQVIPSNKTSRIQLIEVEGEKFVRKMAKPKEMIPMDLRNLSHPNLIKIVDTMESKGWIAIIMELCADGSFEKLITDRSISKSAMMAYFQQAADAISYLHSLNLCHKTLNASNFHQKRTGQDDRSAQHRRGTVKMQVEGRENVWIADAVSSAWREC